MAFRNAIVDLRSGEVVEPTPDLWIHAAVDIDWDPEAQCPRWERFLKEVFPSCALTILSGSQCRGSGRIAGETDR
jgi:phage/plasmid-associated DNA primase